MADMLTYISDVYDSASEEWKDAFDNSLREALEAVENWKELDNHGFTSGRRCYSPLQAACKVYANYKMEDKADDPILLSFKSMVEVLSRKDVRGTSFGYWWKTFADNNPASTVKTYSEIQRFINDAVNSTGSFDPETIYGTNHVIKTEPIPDDVNLQDEKVIKELMDRIKKSRKRIILHKRR